MKTMRERFEEKTKASENGCINWTASITNVGYGQFWSGQKERKAHRISYELYVGPIPDGLYVLHKCVNPICVNPKHLFLVTQLDNIRDCINKGRFKTNKGSENGNALLSEIDVLEIKILSKMGIKPFLIIKWFGIRQSTVSNILTGKTWRHVQV